MAGGEQSPMDKKILCSVSDAVQMLGIGRTTLYALIGSGDLESVRIGSRRLIKITSIEKLANPVSGGEA